MSAVPSRTDISSEALVPGPGGNGDVQIPKPDSWYGMGVRGAERLLATDPEPPLGTHIVTERRGYTHHGIYVGGGKVVHYAGLARGLRRGPVEEVSLDRFTSGHSVWVVSGATSRFDQWEVIRRARSRLGEDCYRLFTNNCEHFCEWCLYDRQRSVQVEQWLARPARALDMMIRFIARCRACWIESVCVRPAPSLRIPVENPGNERRRQEHLA